MGIFWKSPVTFLLGDGVRPPQRVGMPPRASTEAVRTSGAASVTADALVFRSPGSGHKPQVRAVGTVSWALVRAG